MLDIRLQKVDIKKIIFDNKLISEKGVALEVSEEYTVDIDVEKKGCIGKLKLNITTNPEESQGTDLAVELVVYGYFSSNETLENQDEVGFTTHSKLFPHVQSTLRTFTCLCGIPPITLPEISINPQIKKNEHGEV